MAEKAAAVPGRRRQPTQDEFIEMQESSQFQDLRKTFRGFTFPVFIAAMIWFLFYMMAALWMQDFMAQPLWGMNIGLWLGVAQFVTTFAITWVYIVYANKNLEPRQAAIREQMEG
ncbi:DUF485 domain-containing protein [Corynebacterium yudongzhengii]|uniref:DUF485 domain-containing protein n=1 Tax=Corynebacterium yudongzhengii TaxID=2080740 RepID=A0A2U1T7U2_9CORY|nr:DUF485 domain-containing protein [Corynebacterium yudongzhengii]AWB82346.1 DUF485 domain-containing protein [Corynebacterium yudongzhengii]PWC02035.1 DUF485 domain-containing protein [Corynebacterium yudongzhengii]